MSLLELAEAKRDKDFQSRVWFWKRLSRSSFPFVNTGAGAPDTTLAVKPFH